MSTKACIVAILTSSLVEISDTHKTNGGRNVPFAKVLADHSLTQPIRVEKELCNVLRPFALEEASIDKELYALLQNISLKNSRRTTPLTFFGF